MRKIVNGKKYDTDTATCVCDISPNGYSQSDFRWEDTYLYRTKNGNWFIAGEGGPMTRWMHQVGNSYCYGEGLKPVEADYARELLEQFGSAEKMEKYFQVEEA